MAKKKAAVKTAPAKTTPLVSDYYLWSKVAQSISPLKGKKPQLDIFENNEQKDPKLEKPNPKKPDNFEPNYFAPSYSPPISIPKDNSLTIEPKMKRRLARGKTPIDATLDLHDLRQDEAHASLVRFLQISYARNNRNVLVITGKGKKKNDAHSYEFGINYQHGVLRNMLPIWLKTPSLKQIVSGHEQAALTHGGSGAFYVRLKKQKQK